MPIDPTQLDDSRLRQLIENHELRGAFDRPLYRDAVREWNRRKGGALSDLDRTVKFVRQRAREGKFLSYGEVAEAHGVAWAQARYPMNDHLWALVRDAHTRGWPMLSAVIVNAEHVADGVMEEPTLAGFVKAAELLGYRIRDPGKFLRDQQRAVFNWAAEEDTVASDRPSRD